MAGYRVTVPQDYEIRAPVEVEDPDYGTFRDAVYFTSAEYAALSVDQREQKLMDRYYAWRQAIEDAKNASSESDMVGE